MQVKIKVTNTQANKHNQNYSDYNTLCVPRSQFKTTTILSTCFGLQWLQVHKTNFVREAGGGGEDVGTEK